MSAAAGLLAVALLAAGGRDGRARLRSLATPAPPSGRSAAPEVRPAWVGLAIAAVTAAAWATGGPAAGVVGAVAAGTAGVLMLRRAGRGAGGPDDRTGLAARWPLLAACLEAGLPVSAAVRAAAGPLRGRTGEALQRVAALLELGADPAQAWSTAAEQPQLAAFARAAGRSACTGAALARVARDEGDRLRAELADSAHARAERAAVLITGPLGLCFLPAFLVLGIAPVVIGLASQALARW